MVNPRLFGFFYNPKKGWIDGTTQFVNLLKAYCQPGALVLDLGAGAGRGKPHNYSLRGKDRLVVGLDVDSEISENRIVDFKVIGDAYFLPFKECSFDFIYTDFVLEHVDAPDAFLTEVRRVLRKGGYFIFRTPNLYHYVPSIARIVPNRSKSLLANFVRSIDTEEKTFPVIYKMNRPGLLRSILEKKGFATERLELIEKEPSYLVFNTFAFLLGVLYERIVNSAEILKFIRSNILGVFRKI
ncbi:MAG TPA: class I SAM-dependent methyltransferase [Thermodesulfobacteriota bacterium]|nr:class I SAM-dependent methyltransferase [Thermodesulfobacteriota bacterium]